MHSTTNTHRSVSIRAAIVAKRPATRGSRTRQAGASDRRKRQPRAGGAGNVPRSGLSVATLERLEDAILDSLLEFHPNRESAIDRLLHDVNNSETEVRLPAYPRLAASSPECSLQKLRRIEELLVAAIIDGTEV